MGTEENGIGHTAVVTPAKVHDSTVMEECLHGEEEEIYGDQAYVSEERQAQAETDGKTWQADAEPSVESGGAGVQSGMQPYPGQSGACVWCSQTSVGYR